MSGTDPVDLLTEATRFYNSGQLGKALTIVDEALAQAAAQKHAVLVGTMIQKAGWLRELGQADQASEVLSAAEGELQKREPGGGGFEWSSLRLEQAHLAQLRGDLTAAESLLSTAETLARESPAADIQLPDVYANQASLYLDLGRLGEAQEVLFKALGIDRRVSNNRSVANDLNMLGLVYKQLGDTETARAYFEESFGVASENGLMKEAVDAMSNLATLADDKGEHAQAAELFATANRFYVDMRYGSDVACSVSNEGVAALRLNDHARARELLTRAHELHLEAGNQSHAIYDLVNLSNLEVQTGDGERAVSLARAGLASAREHGMIDLQWKLELVVAELEVTLAKADATDHEGVEPFLEALEGLGRAADIIELLRTRVDRPEEREWFLVDKERVYEDAVALCAAVGRPKDLFSYSERGRARAFMDAIGAETIERIEEDDPRGARRAELVSQLLDPAIAAEAKPGLLDELRMLRAQSAAERPAIWAVTDAELPGFEDICAAIPEGACVLEFFQTDKNVFHLLLDRTGLLDAGMTVFDEPVEKVVARFRQEVIDGDPELPTGHSLFIALFRPVMPKLAETARLIVVPHRSLHYIPWSALWFVPAGDDAPPRQYLRSRFLLGTVPSASYLAQRSRSPLPDQGDGVRMVLGDPTGDLEGAAEEAREVAKTLRVHPLLGRAATKEALLEAAPSAVLHVAAHGTYNPEDPLLSGLHMADGLATVEDMLARAPRTRLLVLSGCVTGLSERRPGDELIGLARAALLSGTKSIVVTLWETSDEASMSFFRYFYDALSDGGTVSEAIAWSQHHLATGEGGYDQPVDWAPFLLLGDPDQRLVDPEQTPRAMFDRGALLAQSGDVDGARAAFQAAVDSGSPEVAPRAAFGLGMLLSQQGDVRGALAAWRQAAGSGDPEVAPMASYGTGGLLEDEGDREGARAAYELAINSNHTMAAPLAANNLGMLLAQQGDVEGARAAYQRAIDSHHHEAAPKAANNLGALLSQAGDVEGARAAYQLAIDTADPELSPHAALNLGMLLAQKGDFKGARVALEVAVHSDHPQASPWAAYNLGVLLSNQGDATGALAAFQVAVDGHDPEASRLAAGAMAALRKRGSRGSLRNRLPRR